MRIYIRSATLRANFDPDMGQYSRKNKTSVSPAANLVAALVTLGVCLTLWAAAYAKTFAFAQFVQVLGYSQLVPLKLAPTLGVLVVLAEYVLPLTLFVNHSRIGGILGTAGLFIVYTGYSAWRIFRRIGVPCSCFAGLFTLGRAQTFMLDLSLTTACLLLLWIERRDVKGYLNTLIRCIANAREKAGLAGAYLFLCYSVSFVLISLTVGHLLGQSLTRSGSKVTRAVQVLPIAPADVIGSAGTILGAETSAYTLVEFGDYQCPPCRNHVQRLKDLVSSHQGRLRVVFHYLPLTDIHPMAFQAALVAEIAHRHNCLPAVHHELMSLDIDPRTLRETARRLGLADAVSDTAQEDAARKVVRRDLALANRLGLRGTPAFVLCTPGGRTLLLPDVDAAEAELN